MLWIIILAGIILWLGSAAWRKRHWVIIEMLLSVWIITLLAGDFIWQAHVFSGKAYLLSVLYPASSGRLKVVEEHAFSGRWPGETEPDRSVALKIFYKNNEYVKYLKYGDIRPGGYIRQGAIHVEVQNRKGQDPAVPSEWWSLRPAVAADDAPTILWVCGSNLPPAGFQAQGENLTTIPPAENFRICR